MRTAFSPSFQCQFLKTEARIKDITELLGLHVQTAGFHSSMRRDQKISRLLSGVVDDASDHPSVRLPVRFLQVMPRNDRYYERGLVMEQMATLLAGQCSRMSSVALHGFVGCGKSSIATEYVHRNSFLYQAVMCFDAGDGVKLESQFVQLARHLGFAARGEDASTSRRLVLDWLSTTGAIGNVLARQFQSDIQQTSNGSLFLTMRTIELRLELSGPPPLMVPS